MGGACCIAARDKNIVSGPSNETLHRNIRYSPTWSIRWDNRGRVAGEETSVTWFSDGNSRNDRADIKNELAYASEDGSPFNSSQRCTWQKSPTMSEGATVHARTPASDQSVSRTISMDTSLEQVEKSTGSPIVSDPYSTKFSASLPSTSSVISPLPSESCTHPASSTMPIVAHPPEQQLMGQVHDTQISELKSSDSFSVPEERSPVPSWSNESTQRSRGGSSDCWSMHAFSELMATSYREKWSFDNDSLGFNHERTRSSGRLSASCPVDLQTCGICTKLLTEKPLWSGQKLVLNNELSVVAVLNCGHVYHAECLETMTPEIHKYDPFCPICTLGEKQTHKLSHKAFKAEMDLKAKNKRSRNRIVDSDLDDDSIMLDCAKGDRNQAKGPKMTSSTSMKSSLAKPFLKRHFSFGSKGSKTLTENPSTKKKGFFWTRSLKV